MGSVREALVAWFDARGTAVLAVNDATYSAPAEGQHGEWVLYATVRDEQDQLLVHSVLPIDVPEEQRATLALHLTQVNVGLVIGNFELDLTDGELRYKTSIDVEGGELTDTMLDNLISANVAAVDEHLPGILKILG